MNEIEWMSSSHEFVGYLGVKTFGKLPTTFIVHNNFTCQRISYNT